MLVTFKTDAHADIIMFGDIALELLKMMGHSATVPGAILAADIPAALGRLKTAIDLKRALPSNSNDTSVSIVHRALPLIDLLSSAAKTESDVMWE